MPPLPVATGIEAVSVFSEIGFLFDHQRGSHVILKHMDGRHLSVPGGRSEIKAGTLRTLIKQAGLTVEEFIHLQNGR